MTTSYEVVAYREGEWWVFEIPALTSMSKDGTRSTMAVGQARTKGEIPEEARLLAALWTETDEADIAVQVSYRLPETPEERAARYECGDFEISPNALIQDRAEFREGDPDLELDPADYAELAARAERVELTPKSGVRRGADAASEAERAVMEATGASTPEEAVRIALERPNS